MDILVFCVRPRRRRWRLSEGTPGMGRWPLVAEDVLPRYGRTETAGRVVQLKPDDEFPNEMKRGWLTEVLKAHLTLNRAGES